MEEKFSEVWDYLLSRRTASIREDLADQRDLGREAYEVLCHMAPSLATNKVIAAGWVYRIAIIGQDAFGDMIAAMRLAQIEFYLRSCELISALVENERREMSSKSI